jgi:hypothetical protein
MKVTLNCLILPHIADFNLFAKSIAFHDVIVNLNFSKAHASIYQN